MRYIQYVNIKQGTKSEPRFSHGNTLPLVQLPFGMTAFAPQTHNNGGWFFNPDARWLEGVRLTHQPSPWINDYGTLLFAPQTGIIHDSAAGGWSGYRPEEAVFRPDYLKLTFLRSRAVVELTPSERGAKLRFSYNDENRTPYLSFFPVKGQYKYDVNFDNDSVTGYTTGHSGDISVDFKMYFVIKFANGSLDREKTRSVNDNPGEGTVLHLAFNTHSVEADIITSYVSLEQATVSYERELSGKSFDDVKKAAEMLWESYFSRVEIEAYDEHQLKTFYTCMYRAYLFPHKAYELDENGKPVHYTPCDGKVRPGVRYTDNGFWDTYRTVYPFFALTAKEEYADMLTGFVNDYLECGWLPRWLSIGEVGCMPSTLIDAVIADAAVKEIVSRDVLENALRGMLNHANNEAPDRRYGRNGVLQYAEYGYVPRDCEGESVNLTLDAAYGDFCIAEVARVLGYEDIEKEYRVRSKNYRKLFDSETGFMRGRDRDGKMSERFDEYAWGGEYTEAGPWQTTFAVPHDIDGLAELFGGREKMIEKLDALFAAYPYYSVDGYNGEIHEMTEMAAQDFGQCAINNQPSFHIPYLYAMLGKPEKAHYWVKKICDTAFSYKDDGFPGDEDNGTMACWYIFACLGIYPVCPGKNEYAKIPMLVKSAKILGKAVVK